MGQAGFPMIAVVEREPMGTEQSADRSARLLTITDARGITYLTNTYCSGTACPPDHPAVVSQTLADGGVYQVTPVVTSRSVTQATVTDPRGNKTAHRFNGRNQPVGTVDALGQQTRMTRDYVSNQVLEVRDPLNRLTKYTYDLAGNVNSVLNPQQNPTIFEYESTFNRVTKITDALNQNTRFTYDPATGNLLPTTDPLNHATSIAYNQFGQPISVTDALNHTTSFEYDEVGNLIATVDPLGNRTLRFYDAVSRLIAIVDGRGKATQFTYDQLNRVTQIEDAINGITAFTYDPNGNLLTVTDAKNQTTTYTYVNMDRLATRTDALNRTESYQYDLAGNLTQFTDRKNQVTTFQYDALNRRRITSYADSTTVGVSYDTVGNVTKLTDSATGAIDWTYDVLDRVTQEVTPQGIVNYTYDVLSRRLTMRANAQQPVTYGYDANSQLSQVTQGALSATLAHDPLGRRTQLQRSNGVTTTYNYDPASRLQGITHAKGATVLEQLTHGLDQVDNKNHVTQLIQAATALPPAVTAAYDVANAQTQVNTTTSQTLGYDPNGNLAITAVPAGSTTYTWDVRDRLIGITGPNLTASLQYDALDRRIAKTINSTTTSYQYDMEDLLIETGPTQATYLSSLNIDEPIVRQTSSGSEFYLANDLGSTLALTNDAGAVTTTYTYSPFGTTTINGASTNPVQFTGRENDGNDLYYYRARYYKPSHGRFIAEDPLEFAASDANLYTYVFNNPTNYTDPSGEIVPALLAICLRGAGQSIAQDIGLSLLAGRKVNIDWSEAARSCLTGGLNKGFNAAKSFATSRAARRAAMRQQGIPTSRPPISQSGPNGQRQYIYTGSDNKPYVVTQHLPDKDHKSPHWHAAPAKTDDKGQPRLNKHGQFRYQSGGSTASY
ncbi:MAG: hypothetical protein BVN28_08195 [Nitrospira sp. ST-bin4]|nr:MAG: hypothetical protein BVN28_08195 [Nitrospira sp. ST-bin4]